MGLDPPLAHGEIPYVFPPGGRDHVRPAVGEATAQHSRPGIGHVVHLFAVSRPVPSSAGGFPLI